MSDEDSARVAWVHPGWILFLETVGTHRIAHYGTILNAIRKDEFSEHFQFNCLPLYKQSVQPKEDARFQPHLGPFPSYDCMVIRGNFRRTGPAIALVHTKVRPILGSYSHIMNVLLIMIRS